MNDKKTNAPQSGPYGLQGFMWGAKASEVAFVSAGMLKLDERGLSHSI